VKKIILVFQPFDKQFDAALSVIRSEGTLRAADVRRLDK
jgi:hypothetical protein